jgi:citrate synthase
MTTHAVETDERGPGSEGTRRDSMANLHDTLAKLIPQWRDDIGAFVKEYGDAEVGTVTLKQIYGGMRGVRGLICDTSAVEPDRGLVIRGKHVSELTENIPEEILWFLLTASLPNKDELKSLQDELNKRCKVPDYVWSVLRAMPKDSHPMCMLDTAILCMERESAFRKHYDEGMTKDKYWEATLEDMLNILAILPAIAAGVYRIRFDKGDPIEPDTTKDWSENYVHMLGIPDPTGDFARLMRLYLVLHSDHESGNVSANAGATVCSALSDLYYGLSAGLNGLAGPLHGLANQQCLKWVLETRDKFGGVPTNEQLEKYAWETLSCA